MNYCDGYYYEDPNQKPWPNLLPYTGGKFRVTFTGGDTLEVYCHWHMGSCAQLIRLDNGYCWDCDYHDMAHVEEMK